MKGSDRQSSHKIFGVSSSNFWIYVISFVISIGFIALGFIKGECFKLWATLFMSVGASGIGAVLLAFFIERSNNIQSKNTKNAIRRALVAPMRTDLVQIICSEILIIEKENADFKQKIQDKTLREIIVDIDALYHEKILSVPTKSEDYIQFCEDTKDRLSLRLKASMWLGGLTNYVVNDIYGNRTYNLYCNLFTDQEIEHLRIVQSNLSKVKSSQNYVEYLWNFLEFIAWIDYFDSTKSLFKEFNFIKKSEDAFFDENGNEILLGSKVWINK